MSLEILTKGWTSPELQDEPIPKILLFISNVKTDTSLIEKLLKSIKNVSVDNL